MKQILMTMMTVLGGWMGWWLGSQFGIFAAVILAAFGTGAGLYFGRRLPW